MRRQRRTHYTEDDDYHPIAATTSLSQSLLKSMNDVDMNDFIQMERLQRSAGGDAYTSAHRFENTIEAKIEDGDTLQALALRFHCTVADIKRLNKIDKENEIHARKVIKIPVTVHSVLLGGALPTVHKSGNNSPKHLLKEQESNIMRNPLEDARVMLSEKLMVASVNASGGVNGSDNTNINNIILHSKVMQNANVYTDDDSQGTFSSTAANDKATAPLLDVLDDEILPQLRPIRGPSLSAIDWSGSDCDMSWICLFVFILALCFVIPLVYVIYLAEHPHHHSNATSH